MGGGGQTLRSEPAQDVSYGDRVVTTALLARGKEGGAAQVREDRRRGSASSQKVDEAGEGGKSLGSTIRGGASNGLL